MKAYRIRILVGLVGLLGMLLVAIPPALARPGGAGLRAEGGTPPPAYTLDPRTAGDDAEAA